MFASLHASPMSTLPVAETVTLAISVPQNFLMFSIICMTEDGDNGNGIV